MFEISLKLSGFFVKLEDPWNQHKPRTNVEPLPTQDPAVLKCKREHILAELLETEQVYVTELHSIIMVSLPFSLI